MNGFILTKASRSTNNSADIYFSSILTRCNRVENLIGLQSRGTGTLSDCSFDGDGE